MTARHSHFYLIACFLYIYVQSIRFMHSIVRGATGGFTPPEQKATVRISIHAPLAGCNIFSQDEQNKVCISIHAPLAGCNPGTVTTPKRQKDFNSCTPRGVQLLNIGVLVAKPQHVVKINAQNKLCWVRCLLMSIIWSGFWCEPPRKFMFA